MGRPSGEISLALLRAVEELQGPDRCPTAREIATHAKVGFAAAKASIGNMRRAGRLHQARLRRVSYRTRPVAEYCTFEPVETAVSNKSLGSEVAAAIASWR